MRSQGANPLEAVCSLRYPEGTAAFSAGHQPCDPLYNLSISESVHQSMVTYWTRTRHMTPPSARIPFPRKTGTSPPVLSKPLCAPCKTNLTQCKDRVETLEAR